MEQVALGPPPLPPKTRKSPPQSATEATATTVHAASALTEDIFTYSIPEVRRGHSQITSTSTGNHVVKILINPQHNDNIVSDTIVCSEITPCIRISVNQDNEMIQNTSMSEAAGSNAYFFYNHFNCNTVMSSGQISPSDTLDSGTCSDLDSNPPALPQKKISSGVTVTVIGAQHKRAASLTSSGADIDSEDDESNISCDSLNSGDLPPTTPSPPALPQFVETQSDDQDASSFLPQGLLQDIRDRAKLAADADAATEEDTSCEELIECVSVISADLSRKMSLVDESTYEKRREDLKIKQAHSLEYDTDRFYHFHMNEHLNTDLAVNKVEKINEDDNFAGYKDLLGSDGSSTIRSAKGTVRGVKNRVRAGIATFLQINDQAKSYKEKDCGKVVVFTTTMGIVRETHNACMKVKQIMRTLLVKFEERDVFMSTEYQAEIQDRMRCDHILVPQVFVDGQHIGDAETVERLNETGELRRILRQYKSMDSCTTCQACGGYRLLPCQVCNGSKKSVHRNHFTAEFVALKCMNCDEVGLVKCSSC